MVLSNVNKDTNTSPSSHRSSYGSEAARNRKLEKMKQKYSNSTQEERQQHSQKSSNYRAKRKSLLEKCVDTQKDGVHPRRRINWLLKAQSTSYETESELAYAPSCSDLHILKDTNNCGHCGAKRFEFEPPTFCCDNGKIELPATSIPKDLQELFMGQSEEAQEFQTDIRLYNSIFSFTCFVVDLDKELASNRKGIYTFRVHGQVYQHFPGLLPTRDGGGCYFQLYFHDAMNEVQNRMNIINNGCVSESLIRKIMKILEVNPYAKVFKCLKDMQSIDDVHLHISQDVNLDQRTYNAPTSDQVAAIWIEGNNPHIPIERQIIIHSHSGHKHSVKHYFGCYDALQYPLLFPFGEVGWQRNILKIDPRRKEESLIIPRSTTTTITPNQQGENEEQSNFLEVVDRTAEQILEGEERGVQRDGRKTVSCREYYCYKVQDRTERESTLHYAGRLFQQYVVDQYIKLETTRLDYFRSHQDEIRAELYQGIVDSVVAGETRADEVGQRLVLPSTFIGGDRDMKRRYLDSMALVQKFGKPDLFITMTCNSEWIEIQKELKNGQHPQDRPDLTARVFRAKLQDLKDQLFKKHIFGEVAAHVHVIEFQKRGLPHAHLLIILKSEYKLISPDQYDKFVCAEIPDESEYPELYRLVVKHMMHGPCGEKNTKNSCMVDGQCKYHYPRDFCGTTIQGKDGYPIYRRAKDNKIVRVRNAYLDNKWVVPYNAYLLTRYNCHINVEICSGVQAVKYLYKYIYKGHDRVSIHIAHEKGEIVDEIQRFQDARWVSAQESLWRIFEFSLSDIYPAVIKLQLHLPNKQCVIYRPKDNLKNILTWDHVSKTMLTEYFSMCRKHPKAKALLYQEFPEYYVWNQKDRSWHERKKRDVIGRINGVNPIEGERYYLRLLLNHVRGPTSFEDLLTVSGVLFSSFKEAAQKRGLLESDRSIVECLNEAITFKMPFALRRLFATILVHCEPTDVRNLYHTYFDSLSEDFKRGNHPKGSHTISTEFLEISTLKSIKYFLESMGKKMKEFDLPSIPRHFSDFSDSSSREIQDEMSIETPNNDYTIEDNLNAEQHQAFSQIIHRVKSGKSGVFFIDGPGGTGKTYLYRALLAHLRLQNILAIATATSGVAAHILPGGRTAHSRFKIPIEANEKTYCNLKKQSGLGDLLRAAKLFIWDEAPMAKRWAIETLDRTMRDVVGNKKQPFGGKVIVFGGDYRQVLPVVPKGTIQQTIDASLVKSDLWDIMEKFSLTKNMRARLDSNFSEFLLRVGNGEEPTNSDGKIEIPKEMIIHYDNEDSSEQRLIDAIFPSLSTNGYSIEYMSNRAILAPKNEHVDNLNSKLIGQFPGEERIYASFDDAIDDTHNYYTEDFLHSLTPNGLPPHKLVLKKNCPIILLRNLDPSNGLCNGTRMICKSFENNVIHAKITEGTHAGKEIFIPRIPLLPKESDGYPFKFRRKQFPIRLCFAMTINKAQGQTIENVGIYLPSRSFPMANYTLRCQEEHQCQQQKFLSSQVVRA